MHYKWHHIYEFFVILDHYLPFYSYIDPENEHFEKTKNVPRYIIILKICTINDNHNVWFLRFGAQQTKFFCHFGPFFDLLPSWKPGKLIFWKIKKTLKILLFFTCAHHKWQLYDVCLLKYGAQQAEFFVTLYHFSPFYPFTHFLPYWPRKQRFWKNKKHLEILSFYHKKVYHKYDNDMMYDSWDMEHNRQIFLSIWTVFCPFTPLTTQKIEILKT